MERNNPFPYQTLVSDVNSAERGYQPEQPIPTEARPPPVQGQEQYAAPPDVNAGQPGELGWWKETRRNKAQLNSSSAAALIFGSAGLNLAYSVGFSSIYNGFLLFEATHLQICWFIAVIIGACFSMALVEKLTQRASNAAASILVITGGILFTAAKNSVPILTIARYCDGIAFGFTLIPFIVTSSEKAVKKIRGIALSSEHFGLISGIILKTINAFSDKTEDTNLIQGILSTIYGVLAFISIFIYTKERPIYHLRQGDDETALDVIRQMQKPETVTPETYQLLNENKQLILEDATRGWRTNLLDGLLPLLKVCLHRAIVAMSFSLPLVCGFVISSGMSSNHERFWSLYLFIFLRMLGIFFGAYTMDTLGRKYIGVFSFFAGGVLLLVVASLFSNFWDILQEDKMAKAALLLQAYQLFAGIAAPIATCYAAEAFSISVKPAYITVAVVFENLLQIVICCQFEMQYFSNFGYALGALQIVFAVIFFLMMPETKNTTLRQALEEFRKPFHFSARLN